MRFLKLWALPLIIAIIFGAYRWHKRMEESQARKNACAHLLQFGRLTTNTMGAINELETAARQSPQMVIASDMRLRAAMDQMENSAKTKSDLAWLSNLRAQKDIYEDCAELPLGQWITCTNRTTQLMSQIDSLIAADGPAGGTCDKEFPELDKEMGLR